MNIRCLHLRLTRCAWQDVSIAVNQWLPLRSDGEDRLHEAIARLIVSTFYQALPPPLSRSPSPASPAAHRTAAAAAAAEEEGERQDSSGMAPERGGGGVGAEPEQPAGGGSGGGELAWLNPNESLLPFDANVELLGAALAEARAETRAETRAKTRAETRAEATAAQRSANGRDGDDANGRDGSGSSSGAAGEALVHRLVGALLRPGALRRLANELKQTQ